MRPKKARNGVGVLLALVLSGAALASAQPDPARPEFGGDYEAPPSALKLSTR